jgi:hypothetical protein
MLSAVQFRGGNVEKVDFVLIVFESFPLKLLGFFAESITPIC